MIKAVWVADKVIPLQSSVVKSGNQKNGHKIQPPSEKFSVKFHGFILSELGDKDKKPPFYLIQDGDSKNPRQAWTRRLLFLFLSDSLSLWTADLLAWIKFIM